MHAAQDVLLDIGGQARRSVLLEFEIAAHVFFHTVEPFGQNAALTQSVLVSSGLEIKLDLRHDLDHLLEVGVVVAHHVEVFEVDSFSLASQIGLFPGETSDISFASGIALGAFEAFARLTAFLAAAGRASDRVGAVIFDLARDVSVIGQSGRRVATSLPDGLFTDEFTARFALTPFAGSTGSVTAAVSCAETVSPEMGG